MKKETVWKQFNLPEDIAKVLEEAPSVSVAESTDELFMIATGNPDSSYFKVGYEVEGKVFGLRAVQRFPGLDPLWNIRNFITVHGLLPVGDLRQLRRENLDFS